MNIEICREKIDEIDKNILKLINQRAEFALKIGELKKSEGLEIFDPKRENFVLQNLTRENQGPLQTESVINIFKIIIQEHRSLEENNADTGKA